MPQRSFQHVLLNEQLHEMILAWYINNNKFFNINSIRSIGQNLGFTERFKSRNMMYTIQPQQVRYPASSDISSLPSSFNSASSKTSPRSESPITCSENSSSKHIWKAEGEDVLVNLMHAKKDKLLKSQNHTALWKKISVELNETLQRIVSPNQAINNYCSLKTLERTY